MKRLSATTALAALALVSGCATDATAPGAPLASPSLSVAAAAHTRVVVVTPATLNGACQTAAAPAFCFVAFPSGWLFYNDETEKGDPTLGSFVTGPGTPLYGIGSAQISVTGTQRRNLATYQFAGTPLANITTMSFRTYNPSLGNGGSVNRSAYLQFNVDFNGTDTWQRRLVYVPSQNGVVLPNTWKEWDAINGGNALWSYSGATWPGTGTPGTTLRPWSEILAAYPTIRIRVTDAQLSMRVGEPYPDGYTENIDSFTFGTAARTTIFDFEPGGVRGSNFTVLANAAVSCSGGSITGDVGTFRAPGEVPPGSVTQTTGCLIMGTVHVGDAIAKQAFNNFLNTYAAFAPKPGDCDAAHTLLSTIAASMTLPPGVYCTGAGLTATDVTLTLDALGNSNAVWLFKIGTLAPGALTGTNFSVVMAGSGQACNVTWWVNAAATMSTSHFQGNILAGTAISMTGGTLNGNAWAKADVTFTEGTVVTGCASSKGRGDDNDNDNDKNKDKDKDKDKGDKGDKDKDHGGDHGDDRGGHDG